MRTSPAQSTPNPELVISAADEERLAELAASISDSRPELAEALLGELARARSVGDDAVPPGTVRMGSTLTYEAEGQQRRVTLVFPSEADIDAGKVSVLTPIGAALIGLSEGQSIDWTALDGRTHRLTILSVEPPAAE